MANETDRNDGGEFEAGTAVKTEDAKERPQVAPESESGPVYTDEVK